MKTVVGSFRYLRWRELVGEVEPEVPTVVEAVRRSSEEVPGWAGRSERPPEVVEREDFCTGQHLY